MPVVQALAFRWAVVLAGLAVAGCAATYRPSQPPAKGEPNPGAVGSVEAASPVPARTDGVIAQNDRFVIYTVAAGDTLASLARRFLGYESLAWMIADANDTGKLEAGQSLIIPLTFTNRSGVHANGVQLVTVLCYHRFGRERNKMVTPVESFAAQLEYLARHDYRVIRLADLDDFLSGKRAIPKRAVVITIDDGYASAYSVAFPLLKKYGFPATVFVYTDFVGSRDGLSWPQMKEMADSGLIEIQSHSKTHANLSLRLPDETDQQYRDRIDREARVPRDMLQARLPERVMGYAYPYGDSNDTVIERLQHSGHRLAFTVNPGGNSAFSYPMMLQRTMIFGDHDLEAFKAKLEVFKELNLR
jgi:peptidoglycan/xylan/chitin deacetylase (PgdA/CDA1 family)